MIHVLLIGDASGSGANGTARAGGGKLPERSSGDATARKTSIDISKHCIQRQLYAQASGCPYGWRMDRLKASLSRKSVDPVGEKVRSSAHDFIMMFSVELCDAGMRSQLERGRYRASVEYRGFLAQPYLVPCDHNAHGFVRKRHADLSSCCGLRSTATGRCVNRLQCR